MKKKYINPIVQVVEVKSSAMLSCSYDNAYDHICTDTCKIWHICRDRQKGKECYDKKYK